MLLVREIFHGFRSINLSTKCVHVHVELILSDSNPWRISWQVKLIFFRLQSLKRHQVTKMKRTIIRKIRDPRLLFSTTCVQNPLLRYFITCQSEWKKGGGGTQSEFEGRHCPDFYSGHDPTVKLWSFRTRSRLLSLRSKPVGRWPELLYAGATASYSLPLEQPLGPWSTKVS